MLKLHAALSLAIAARGHEDVDAGIGRALVGLVAPWMTASLVLRQGGREVEADPASLGFLFEDSGYRWWWIRTTAELPVYTCAYVDFRDKRGSDMGPLITSGDPTFDARYVVAIHPSMPDCHDVATAIIASSDVRRSLTELLIDHSDSCTIGSHISLTRKRTDASLDDALTQMKRVADLAAAQEHALTAGPYR
jgi:hypothetical protein